jgi:hypothetical protein
MSTMNPDTASEALPLALMVDAQDHLLTTTFELARLQGLLDDSHHSLQSGFFGALALLDDLAAAGRIEATVSEAVRVQLLCAVKALQLQDMATQLIDHTSRRLKHCADRLALEAFAGDDEDDGAVISEVPGRPNPVTQSVMQSGFVELF